MKISRTIFILCSLFISYPSIWMMFYITSSGISDSISFPDRCYNDTVNKLTVDKEYGKKFPENVVNTVKADKENPHYFNYKGKIQPLVGTGGGNCYGFVLNSNFNYPVFFDTVLKYRINYLSITAHQIFRASKFTDMDLPLAPRNADGILQPWKATTEQCKGGFWPYKFDLKRWNPAYFKRLREFIDHAARYDIVVNVFFDDLTSQDEFDRTAFNPANNINGTEYLSPADYFNIVGNTVITAFHDDMIRKIVQELNYADNVIYFICDEIGHPGSGRDSSYYKRVYNWLSHKIDVIQNTEKSLPKKHLVAAQQQMNVFPLDFSGDSRTGFNVLQYTWWGWNRQTGGLRALDYEYHHNKPLDFNETKNIRKDGKGGLFYPGDQRLCQRLDMWSFMLGGGASFLSNNKEFTLSAPGGLNPEFNSNVLSDIKNLRDFLDSLPLAKMTRSDMKWISSSPAGASLRGISLEGNYYAMYMHHSKFMGGDSSRYFPDTGGFSSGTIKISMPPGSSFHYTWIDPSNNRNLGEGIVNGGTEKEIPIPSYSIRPDIVLKIFNMYRQD